MPQKEHTIVWQASAVNSPHFSCPTAVVVGLDIPYLPNSNRFQTLNLYLPSNAETLALVGTPATTLPKCSDQSTLPPYHVHIHGGAWRDPELTATSIEPMVAHAFADTKIASPLAAVASINYTISPFPNHPTLPYASITDNHSDPSRDAIHPQHVSDVLQALKLLRSFGLSHRSYMLSGHSAGACTGFQAILESPSYYGLSAAIDVPYPVAMLGLNGLYDLPDLVYALGASHGHLREEYKDLLSSAFGSEESGWAAASPARFSPASIAERVKKGQAPSLVLLDESTEDQLVPMVQLEQLQSVLAKVDGLQVLKGRRCTGKHSAPWEDGMMIWESIQDVLQALREIGQPEASVHTVRDVDDSPVQAA